MPATTRAAAPTVTTDLATARPAVGATASSRPRRCGTIAVPTTSATAAVTASGPVLACATARRVVRTAYGRTVLVSISRVSVRDSGRTYACRYTPRTGAMRCVAGSRVLRATI